MFILPNLGLACVPCIGMQCMILFLRRVKQSRNVPLCTRWLGNFGGVKITLSLCLNGSSMRALVNFVAGQGMEYFTLSGRWQSNSNPRGKSSSSWLIQAIQTPLMHMSLCSYPQSRGMTSLPWEIFGDHKCVLQLYTSMTFDWNLSPKSPFKPWMVIENLHEGLDHVITVASYRHVIMLFEYCSHRLCIIFSRSQVGIPTTFECCAVSCVSKSGHSKYTSLKEIELRAQNM